MTNPGNAVGTNGAFGGRTSVNAFNDVLGLFSSRGILSGWGISPSSGMTVAVGGDGSTRDVAIAEDNAGNKTTIDNISEEPIEVTIESAPASNSRIDAVVAYVDNPPTGSSTVVDNPEACGLIAVSGTTASSPSAPDESDIRTAITTDGGSGSTAYYVVLGYITVASGTTDITASEITAGDKAVLTSDNIDWPTIEPVALSASDFFETTNYTITSFTAYYIEQLHLVFIAQIIASGCPTTIDQFIIGTIKSEFTPATTVKLVGFNSGNTSVGYAYITSGGYLRASFGDTASATRNGVVPSTTYIPAF